MGNEYTNPIFSAFFVKPLRTLREMYLVIFETQI